MHDTPTATAEKMVGAQPPRAPSLTISTASSTTEVFSFSRFCPCTNAIAAPPSDPLCPEEYLYFAAWPLHRRPRPFARYEWREGRTFRSTCGRGFWLNTRRQGERGHLGSDRHF